MRFTVIALKCDFSKIFRPTLLLHTIFLWESFFFLYNRESVTDFNSLSPFLSGTGTRTCVCVWRGKIIYTDNKYCISSFKICYNNCMQCGIYCKSHCNNNRKSWKKKLNHLNFFQIIIIVFIQKREKERISMLILFKSL